MVSALGLTDWTRTPFALLAAMLLAGCYPGFEVGSSDGGAEAADAISDMHHGGSGDSSRDSSRDSSTNDTGSTNVCNPCVAGALQCQGSNVQKCTTEEGGCTAWVTTLECTGSSPFCISGACGAEPPSCAPGGAGMSTCGLGGTASCCASPGIDGGTFYRSYDGVSTGFQSTAYPATVSSLRLDQYEVTVGRFRQFVNAVDTGWKPALGSGKHTHLNGGLGLVVGANVDAGQTYEEGWEESFYQSLRSTPSPDGGWNSSANGLLECKQASTWTTNPEMNESLPITCTIWEEAYAFCIWDGGFLPSEAEWNYAAAGGTAQKAYPWSPAYHPDAGTPLISCLYANYLGCDGDIANPVGSESPAGDGAWGQSDLGGNAAEWSLDWYVPYATPCIDCANLIKPPIADAATCAMGCRVNRGGAYSEVSTNLLASQRNGAGYAFRGGSTGFRCARTPLP
jgi:formylglycine-generating enzyme required for sulfatase activity